MLVSLVLIEMVVRGKEGVPIVIITPLAPHTLWLEVV